MPTKLLIATKNKAKLARFQRLLAGYKLDLVSLSDLRINMDIEETESTFKANALLKAKTYYELSHMPVLAEDSGLVIPVLNDWPGIYSRRVWGPELREATDEEAIAEVLKRMNNIPDDNRQAYFVSDIALIMLDGKANFGHGEAWGKIASQSSKRIMKGFPYRSIFILDGDTKTIAELEDEAVHADYLTQRKNAIIQLEPYLKQLENYA